jgi:hypothetical protein
MISACCGDPSTVSGEVFFRNIRLTEGPPVGTVLESTSYVYDASDRRVQRTHDSDGAGTAQAATSEYFVYDGAQLSMTFNDSQVLTHRYLYGPQIDQVLVDEVFARVVPRYANNASRPYEIFYQARINGQTIARTFENP